MLCPAVESNTTEGDEAMAIFTTGWMLVARAVLVAMVLAIGLGAGTREAAAAGTLTYRGTATVRAELFDVYGRSRGVASYRTPVVVLVAAPRRAPNGIGETNPFALVVQSEPMVNQPGEFSLWSSLPAQGIMFQYWTYEMLSETRFAGTLTRPHQAEAMVLNMVTLPTEIAPHLTMPYVQMMHEGTQMVGEITTDAAIIHVRGMAGVSPFLITLEAQRA
jgi:hypothetical protein